MALSKVYHNYAAVIISVLQIFEYMYRYCFKVDDIQTSYCNEQQIFHPNIDRIGNRDKCNAINSLDHFESAQTVLQVSKFFCFIPIYFVEMEKAFL